MSFINPVGVALMSYFGNLIDIFCFFFSLGVGVGGVLFYNSSLSAPFLFEYRLGLGYVCLVYLFIVLSMDFETLYRSHANNNKIGVDSTPKLSSFSLPSEEKKKDLVVARRPRSLSLFLIPSCPGPDKGRVSVSWGMDDLGMEGCVEGLGFLCLLYLGFLWCVWLVVVVG